MAEADGSKSKTGKVHEIKIQNKIHQKKKKKPTANKKGKKQKPPDSKLQHLYSVLPFIKNNNKSHQMEITVNVSKINKKL